MPEIKGQQLEAAACEGSDGRLEGRTEEDGAMRKMREQRVEATDVVEG